MFIHLFIWQSRMLVISVCRVNWVEGARDRGWGSCGLWKGTEEKLREVFAGTKWQDLVIGTQHDLTPSLPLLGFLVLCSPPISPHQGHI